MTYEQKMQLIRLCKPEKKDLLLAKIIKGETVDITQNEDLFYQVNKDRVTLETFVNRRKFDEDAKEMQWARQNLTDKRHAQTHTKKMRWLGDIPAEIYFSRPEFSPLLPKEERAANIRKFLNDFPSFRAGEGKL